jgi:IS30 family transposase
MCGQVKRRIEKYMRDDQLSPEQIVGFCRNQGLLMVGKSSIYDYIHKDKQEGGDLWKHCRFKLKHRSRPVGKNIPIKNRIGIEQRPPEADGTRFGDWELDLMSDSEGRNFKLTLVERSTLFSIIRNLPNGKVAADVAKVTVDALLPFKRGNGVKTITTDNGTEFYEHEYMSKKLGAPVFFTNPYCSWEKGCIENTNMLYRQYLPRDPSFALWTDEKLLELQHKLNRRPRKKIGFDLPYRKFYLSLQS